jgi:hypothetical protein
MNITMRSQSAWRSRSAATAASWASETKPTSVTAASIPWKRSTTYAADSWSCGSSWGNCGQYAPSPPATRPMRVGRRRNGGSSSAMVGWSVIFDSSVVDGAGQRCSAASWRSRSKTRRKGR